MAILATDPTTVPPQQETTYDQWWIYSLVIDGSDTTNPVATMVLRKCRIDDSGAVEFSPVDGAVTTVVNIFEAAQSDPTVASAVAAIYQAVTSVGTARSLI